jgi:radical SAM superfamily enzyme YgiQ (UPF0313 family)
MSRRATDRTACRALIVNPRFNGDSFWAYKAACELVGARYPAPSLGLLTIAAMLPADWEVRLHDCNVADDDALEAGLDWADLLLVGGMLTQQRAHLDIIEMARARDIPVVVGGPDVSSSPHLYARANFLVIGEAEGCMADFLAAWEGGAREGRFEAPMGSVDVTQSPTPRFDLLDFSQYAEVTVQFSRGCPFRCEFCDIIELYGRKPRTKTTEQMLAELQRLYDLGYRGTIEFSDDNLIGNKKAVKAFLPALVAWQKAHGFPFDFATEASLNLSEDLELLGLLRDAKFFAVFMGIESPDPEVLAMMQKKQNLRRDIAETVRIVQSHGIFVLAGFIVGFDNEVDGAAEVMVDLIEDAAISICMVGLLYALPNTQLTRRLQREGRLHAENGMAADSRDQDHSTAGLNFETLRPRNNVLRDYRAVVEHIHRPEVYFRRVRRTIDQLDCSGANGTLLGAGFGHNLKRLALFLWNVTTRHPAMRGEVWRTLAYALLRNPRAFKASIHLTSIYAHTGPFTRSVIAEIDRQVAAQAYTPALVQPDPVAEVALPDVAVA